MARSNLNPYPYLTLELTDGLDAIGNNISSIQSIDNLVDIIYPYIADEWYINAPVITQVEVRALIVEVISCYQNNPYTLIDDVIDDNILESIMQLKSNVPVRSVVSALEDIKNQVTSSDLTFEEQAPLVLALNFGIRVESYWKEQIAASNPWTNFLNRDLPINYAEVPFWVDACVTGSLIGYSLALSGIISPITDVRSTSLIASLVGALTIGSGKVIFNWIPEQEVAFGGDGIKGLFGRRSGPGVYTTINYSTDQQVQTPYAYDRTYNRKPPRYFF